MRDQAEGLRELVAAQGPTNEAEVARKAHEFDLENITGMRRRGWGSDAADKWMEAHPDVAEAMRENRLTSLPPETAEVYRAKLAPEETYQTFRTAIRNLREELANPKPIDVSKLIPQRIVPPHDYASLWWGIEDDLERWLAVGGFDKPHMSNEALAEFWDLMQRRKEQAR